MPDLRNRLSSELRTAGWQVTDTGDRLHASREAILARWWFGSRRLGLQLDCRFDAAARTLFYREVMKEVAVGLPPPILSVTRRSQRGLEVDETRRDSGPFGGGALHYGEARRLLEDWCAEAGWQLSFQFGAV